MLSYHKVKDKPTVLRAFTGLDKPEFEKLLPTFAKAWTVYVEHNYVQAQDRQRQQGGGRKPKLATTEDKLIFILFYFKTYPLQEVIAFLFGLSQGQANEWIHKLSAVLQMALGAEQHLPERDPQNLVEVLAACETLEFVIDGTERRRQRPQDAAQQKTCYSGKQKAHTHKNNVIVQPYSRRVCYLSQTVEGKKHDKKICDEEGYTFPPHSVLLQDTGFQGFAPAQVIVLQPKKKPKNQDLTVEEKWVNRLISSARIIVENIIAGIKRCHIVKNVFRNTKSHFADLVMEVACGLHNFRVACRSKHQVVNLYELYFQ